jgi:hypothetical protein
MEHLSLLDYWPGSVRYCTQEITFHFNVGLLMALIFKERKFNLDLMVCHVQVNLSK